MQQGHWQLNYISEVADSKARFSRVVKLINRFRRILVAIGKILLDFLKTVFVFFGFLVGIFILLFQFTFGQAFPFEGFQGPDTDFSWKCFSEHFSEIDLDKVTGVYCQEFNWQG